MDGYDAIVVGAASPACLRPCNSPGRAAGSFSSTPVAPRNRFASKGSSVRMGGPPADIMREGLTHLARYSTVAFVHAEAVWAAKDADRVIVTLSGGSEVAGRNLILATGVADDLPLKSMIPRHGYEVRDRWFAAIANTLSAVHPAMILPDWGPTTFFTQGVFEPTREEAALLAARGVEVERTPVVELLGEGYGTETLRLADGRRVPAEIVFTAPRTRMASPLAEQLGCAFTDGMSGPHNEVDPMQQTSVPGVFAAGGDRT